MSSSERTPTSSQQQQQQNRVKRSPFANIPTIKILAPPQGRFSIKLDEYCLTYCSQSIAGRVHSKEPNCRSICLRKVFPHEVKNMVSFKTHESVGPDGKAKYPLPKEGQPRNLPRLLGGASNRDSAPARYWDEGWYFWTGQSRWAFLQKTDTMMLDLQKQKQAELKHESRKEVWHDYQEQLKRGVSKVADQRAQSWGPIVPPRPRPDASSLSLLVPLTPDLSPVFENIYKYLQPTKQVLNKMHESFASGDHKRFALRVWGKVKSNEPFILAKRILEISYEQWKQWPREGDDGKSDDGKRDSTKR